ncbi:MAG: hypothetical protein P8182_14890 [Deltaproteobacteria bacterium]
MSLDKRIDSLIEAGWNILHTDFDKTAYRMWKQRAHDCFTALLGPDHPYTSRFRAVENRQENM